MRTTLFLGLAAAAMAACPNGCSGNGICGANDKCSCYQNWQGPDCSLRTCTYALAWADTADGTNQAHYYAECSNKGACDRKTGECKCFDGYEGKGCRRSTCPEGCSGHGTCEYIDELAVDFEDRRTGPGFDQKTTTWTAHSNAVTQSDNTQKNNGFLYQLWDAQKIQGCKCDLGYSGPDCSSRIAPKGDDPLTTVKSVTQSQMITITAGATIQATEAAIASTASGAPVWAGSARTVDAGPNTFFIIYYDQYGGVWRTDAIEAAAPAATTFLDTVTAERTQAALRALPNPALAATNAANIEGAATASNIALNIQFADKPGQTGVQYLFEVVTAYQGDGAFPVSRGFLSTSVGTAVVKELYTANDANGKDTINELAECSDRGLDNGDGECECFDGFRGLACEEQEALV